LGNFLKMNLVCPYTLLRLDSKFRRVTSLEN
jgi:hypothetical protein